jgi:hypothetical protein
MPQNSTIQQAYELLKFRNYRPIKHITVGREGENIDGLEIGGSPFFLHRNRDIIEDILGDGFSVRALPNQNYIYVQLKKEHNLR